jgi:DNA gyrase/topoisomerase IV subunit A
MITHSGIAFGISAHQVLLASRTLDRTGNTIIICSTALQISMNVCSNDSFISIGICNHIGLATKKGWIKRTSMDAFAKTSSRGLVISTLDYGDKLQWSHRCTDTDHDDILLRSSHVMAVRLLWNRRKIQMIILASNCRPRKS